MDHYLWRFDLICFFLMCSLLVDAGHEVLQRYQSGPQDILPSDLLLVHFDSRPLGSYWNTSAFWTRDYAYMHGHKYAYLTSSEKCSYGSYVLSPVWCKVKAMVYADQHFQGTLYNLEFITLGDQFLFFGIAMSTRSLII